MTEPVNESRQADLSSGGYITLGTRYAAYLVDIGPIALTWMALALASSAVAFDPHDQIAEAVFWIRVFWVVIFGSAVFLFWNLWRQGKTGASLGKAFLDFKVVSEKTGQPIGFVRTVVRFFRHVILDCPSVLCIPIGFAVALLNPKRQMIADLLMKTVCVPDEGRPYDATR